MKKIEIAENIDFADSEYNSFHMSEDGTLTIHMKNWQEMPMKLQFFHTAKFIYTLGDVPKSLFEIQENSSILNEVILRMYGHLYKDHKYKLFQLEDIYHLPFIRVVAESAEVIKCTETEE